MNKDLLFMEYNHINFDILCQSSQPRWFHVQKRQNYSSFTQTMKIILCTNSHTIVRSVYGFLKIFRDCCINVWVISIKLIEFYFWVGEDWPNVAAILNWTVRCKCAVSNYSYFLRVSLTCFQLNFMRNLANRQDSVF